MKASSILICIGIVLIPYVNAGGKKQTIKKIKNLVTKFATDDQLGKILDALSLDLYNMEDTTTMANGKCCNTSPFESSIESICLCAAYRKDGTDALRGVYPHCGYTPRNASVPSFLYAAHKQIISMLDYGHVGPTYPSRDTFGDAINIVLKSLTGTQMTQGVQIYNQLVNDFGGMDAAISVLNQVIGVFNDNLGSIVTQIQTKIQSSKDSGKTQAQCLKQQYKLINKKFTKKMVKKIMTQIKTTLSSSDWTIIKNDLGNLIFFSNYGL
ncbi:hypothetical protein Ddc_09864 [Ditylenchus destructor]|nr:hypothetical protein Ddc_09864 [Ditylenchus destructor]